MLIGKKDIVIYRSIDQQDEDDDETNGGVGADHSAGWGFAVHTSRCHPSGFILAASTLPFAPILPACLDACN